MRIGVSDDGAGIDEDAVLRKAKERGLVPQRVETLPREEILALLFTPGFSTAREVTDISGRGVGLDVVVSQVRKHRGDVRLESSRGVGTRFVLTLPLTTSVVDAILVRTGSDLYALPSRAVLSTVRFSQLSTSVAGGRPVTHWDDTLVEIHRLGDLLEGHAGALQPEEIDPQNTVFITRVRARMIGVVVEEVLRKEEFVVKPLPPHVAPLGAYEGASLLETGRLVLILATERLLLGRERPKP